MPMSPAGATVSPSLKRLGSPSRARTRSPQRRNIDQGVHLHLSLTDSQMDKLTSR